MILGMFLFYAVLFLAIIMGWLWMLWFGTRTMFVFPLIAQRQCGFAAAWSQSWRETRLRFWELLIINFVAGLLGMLGLYAMYIGLIFTMPIMFSIIMSVYDERFTPQPGTAQKDLSGEGGGSLYAD
jgi:membrane-anchored glycerophosphoryl diester phosphodiesterase (GDPDase)